MNRNCWLRPLSVQTELQVLFKGIANDLSAHYEDNPGDREEHLEGRLVTLIDHSPVRRVEDRIARERERTGLTPIKLSLTAKHITGQERTHGADMGMVARLSLPGEMTLEKAILVQSKRLYQNHRKFDADSEYPELFRDDGRTVGTQWDRMMEVTPESVYLLYGPERLRIHNSIKEFGLRIVPAQVIKGLSESGATRFTAEMAYEYGQPFGEWIVEDFLCCKKGDPRRPVIETALGQSSDFPVRNVFEVRIFIEPSFSAAQFSNGL